ncbi:MAG: Fe-S cluster assembly protein SufD [Candidatus Omnitrophica bacterium]|nr:Fe-S cluster assembly protein SufD [Candidatus Omnitrophota bacterium]
MLTISTKEKEKTSPLITAVQKYTVELTKSSAASWSSQLRQKSLNNFLTLGVPTIKNEDWKYTNLSALSSINFKPIAQGKFSFQADVKRLIKADEITLVFVNGLLEENLSNLGAMPKGLSLLSLKKALAERQTEIENLLKKYEGVFEPAFISLNRALASDGAFIHIADKTHVEKVIHIIHVTQTAEPALTTPATYIFLGKSAEATVLETHVGYADSVYLAAPLTEVSLGQNAVLHYCKAQSESLKAYHVGNTRVWQERDSHFDGFALMNGGDITRNDLDIISNGEGTSSTMNGFYGVNGKQFVDNHSSMDHRQPNCTSNQLYKGILNGSSNASFNGKIFVRQIAQKTNSYQLNKNLVLGADCKVNTKPQLEIFADDVKCTHGATIGQMNEEEIFYLQSRCISKKTAIKLLAHGFVGDIITKIHNPSIQDKLNILLEPTFAALE